MSKLRQQILSAAAPVVPPRPAVAAMSILEFARQYGVSRSFVYIELAAGRLIARKASGRTIIAAADAEAWLRNLPVLKLHSTRGRPRKTFAGELAGAAS